MDQKASLQLVIIEDTTHKAEALVSALRDAGFTLCIDRVQDLDALTGLINQSEPDLVLCGSGAELPELKAVTTLFAERNSAIPVIALADETTKNSARSARRNGATALVAYDKPDSLLTVLEKEQQTILLRRQVRLLEKRLFETEKCCRDLMESSRHAIAYVRESRHIHANNSYLDLFGFCGTDEIEGTAVMDIIDSVDHSKLGKFLRSHDTDDNISGTLEVRGVEAGNNTFDAVMEFSPARLNDEPCTQLVIRHREDLELEEKLDSHNRQDMLTGLCNRQHFMQVVDNSIRESAGPGQSQAIAYILLDNPKSMREKIGVAGSDMVVNDIARLIESTCQQHDIVARFSDYVFTLLHDDSNGDDVLQLAETLREKVSEHESDIEGHVVTTTCSIGICVINEHTGTAQDVLSRADLACEVARSSGGNQIHIHSMAVDEKMGAQNEEEWDAVISTTISEERFYLAYQAIASLNGNAGGYYEVLLRILDENGDVMLPGQFLSIAEKIGKSGEIDRWVIDTAFRVLMEKRSSGFDLGFFIKLSEKTLSDRELPVWINRKLKEYRLKSDSICFEIPEAVALKDLKNTTRFVKAMQKIHCMVAIEHFGCTSQPQLIQHLPVDLVKIDGSLITGLATSKEQQEKLKSVIDLARKSDIPCVAECVDSASDLAKLWEFGVNFIQGNFVQEPGRNLAHDFEGEFV
ncbi:MAG: EAL domain-containing protein [Gammaproteobacteria bacterium]|nr:MAG: EAL domain-containing protein [Gammaproteobacteria bacterium]